MGRITISNITEKNDPTTITGDINRHLHTTIAKDVNVAQDYDFYKSLVHTVWERMSIRWLRTQQKYYKENNKRVYYLSLEFYMGRTLGNALLNLGLTNSTEEATHQMGLNLEELEECELDAGLGNGGLGRLAACFLDSMSSLGIPGYGYGIRYDYGIFTQAINNGWQIEEPDNWLKDGNPWERIRNEVVFPVYFNGRVEKDENGKFLWVNTDKVLAVACDVPVPGYQNNTCNTLRLWLARAPQNFDLQVFNTSDYIGAVCGRNIAENITRVLYPNDEKFEGKELRLKQEYMLVSASLQDIIRRFKIFNSDINQLPEKVAIQLNDTHPAMAIPELLRLLIDKENLSWETAFDIAHKVFSYTNHTILPEAMERWPISMIQTMLPRHMDIIYKINHHFLETVNYRYPGDNNRRRAVSIVEEGDVRCVNTAFMCIVCSHAVNGVSAIHTQILKDSTFKLFYDLWPEKFQNKTNGITPRRWLLLCNRPLTNFISKHIQGDSWIMNLQEISTLRSLVNNDAALRELNEVKLKNKVALAEYLEKTTGLKINPKSMFDIQVKRIHEYKRQLLNVLHIITMYNRIRSDPSHNCCPRTIMIGGKAAPGYHKAKLIIKLINSVASIINNDSSVKDKLAVVFLVDYKVSLAEKVIPAADLSQQISLASTEASGTGNMKFMLNGALTIGTMDGANVEMSEEVGVENMFIFGNTVEQVQNLRQNNYHPGQYLYDNPELSNAICQIRDGFFYQEEPTLFRDLAEDLFHNDHYQVCADYADYMRAQGEIDQLYLEHMNGDLKWAKMSLLNIAGSGKFSSDRTITEYAKDIWNVPVKREVLPTPTWNASSQRVSDQRPSSRPKISTDDHQNNTLVRPKISTDDHQNNMLEKYDNRPNSRTGGANEMTLDPIVSVVRTNEGYTETTATSISSARVNSPNSAVTSQDSQVQLTCRMTVVTRNSK